MNILVANINFFSSLNSIKAPPDNEISIRSRCFSNDAEVERSIAQRCFSDESPKAPEKIRGDVHTLFFFVTSHRPNKYFAF